MSLSHLLNAAADLRNISAPIAETADAIDQIIAKQQFDVNNPKTPEDHQAIARMAEEINLLVLKIRASWSEGASPHFRNYLGSLSTLQGNIFSTVNQHRQLATTLQQQQTAKIAQDKARQAQAERDRIAAEEQHQKDLAEARKLRDLMAAL